MRTTKILLTILAAAVMLAGCKKDNPTTPVTPAPITGIVAPVTGATPSLTIDDGEGYTAEFRYWENEEGEGFSGSSFAAGTIYRANVLLTAVEGYIIKGDMEEQGFKPDGATSIERVGMGDNSIQLRIIYPATELTPITPAPITGIVAPAASATPSTTIEGGTGYTATFWSWKDENDEDITGTFAAGKVYKANVTLEADNGYTFAGVAVGDLQGFLPADAESIEFTGGSDTSKVLYITYPATEVPLNGRITWRDGKYAITTDPTDAGLYFKSGSIVGIFSGNGANQTLPATNEDEFDTGDIAWNVIDATVWEDIPMGNIFGGVVIDAAYHTVDNVKAGKGDPCRLVGLDLAKIKSTAAGSLSKTDIDNGLWRLPSRAENESFAGYNASTPTSGHWTTLSGSGVIGGIFPNATDGSAATFLPAAGMRDYDGGKVERQGVQGYFWSNNAVNSSQTYALSFLSGQIYLTVYIRDGFSVRCIPQ